MVSKGKTLVPDHCDKNEDTDRAAETGSRAAQCTGESPAASQGAQTDTARILISQCAQKKMYCAHCLKSMN